MSCICPFAQVDEGVRAGPAHPRQTHHHSRVERPRAAVLEEQLRAAWCVHISFCFPFLSCINQQVRVCGSAVRGSTQQVWRIPKILVFWGKFPQTLIESTVYQIHPILRVAESTVAGGRHGEATQSVINLTGHPTKAILANDL